MSAEAVEVLVRTDHHRHGIPADDALDTAFEFQITRKSLLVRVVNCVDVRSVCCEWQLDTPLVGTFLQVNQQFAEAIRAVSMQDVFERL